MDQKGKNTYCLVCRKKTDNKKIRGVTLVNKIATQRSLYTDFTSKKSIYLKPITNKKQKQFLADYKNKCKLIAQNVKNIPIIYVRKN